jgi:hypothetical protein
MSEEVKAQPENMKGWLLDTLIWICRLG